MKVKFISFLLCLFLIVSIGYSQPKPGDLRIKGMNAYIEKGISSAWITVVDDIEYSTTDFHIALQYFFTSKLKKIRTFKIVNDIDGLIVDCKYDNQKKQYCISYYGYDSYHYFDSFYQARLDIEEVLVEAVREGLLYNE